MWMASISWASVLLTMKYSILIHAPRADLQLPCFASMMVPMMPFGNPGASKTSVGILKFPRYGRRAKVGDELPQPHQPLPSVSARIDAFAALLIMGDNDDPAPHGAVEVDGD